MLLLFYILFIKTNGGHTLESPFKFAVVPTQWKLKTKRTLVWWI